MAKHIVTCRICKEKFDAQENERDKFWINPSSRMYYHKKCYENWKGAKNLNDEEYIDMIYDFIVRDLKGKYTWQMIEAQRKKMLVDSRTNKGIYYTLVWYHTIKGKPWKAEYGIGIIPSVYQQAMQYWTRKEKLNKEIFEQHEKLVKDTMEKKPIKINRPVRRKKRKIEVPK